MLEKAVSERLWNIASFNELPHHTSRSSQRVRAADLDPGVASKVCPDDNVPGYRNYATSPWGAKMQDPRSLPSTSESPLGRLETATTGPSAMLHR